VRAGGIGDYKETKSVAPVPAAQCVWQGFYLGLHAGGEFGHSENLDHNYNVGLNGIPPDKPWGYGESGFVGGGQLGYNWQWQWLGLGPEIDLGYMNLNGSGLEPGFFQDTHGETESDFYAYTGSDCHFNIYANGDCYIHSNTDRNGHSHGYVYAYTNSNSYSHADAYTNSHVYSDPDSHSYGHSYSNGNADRDSEASEA
jgi:hypothetical protein